MRTREEIKPEDIIKNKTFLFFKLKLFLLLLDFRIRNILSENLKKSNCLKRSWQDRIQYLKYAY